MTQLNFKDAVINTVCRVPKGRVASYGQIALYIGSPRAARQVGWVLNTLRDITVPWWRIVNNSGRISIKGSQYSASEQKSLLLKEGVRVGADFTFDIAKYRFEPTQKDLAEMQMDKEHLTRTARSVPVNDIYFRKKTLRKNFQN